MARAELARLGDFGRDGVAIDIVLEMAVRLLDDAVLANLRDAVGRRDETDDEGPGRLLELRRKRHAGHERHVRRLEPPVGEVDRGRRLRRAADADQDDVGVVQILGQVAVVVQHGEIECLDAPEIVGIEHMLTADGGRCGRPEIGFEHLENRFQGEHTRHVEPLAALLQLFGQFPVEHGIEDDAGGGLDIFQHPFELAPAAHQGVEVLDGPYLGVLHPDRLGDDGQRLSGRIGDHMEVKGALDIHGNAFG